MKKQNIVHNLLKTAPNIGTYSKCQSNVFIRTFSSIETRKNYVLFDGRIASCLSMRPKYSLRFCFNASILRCSTFILYTLGTKTYFAALHDQYYWILWQELNIVIILSNFLGFNLGNGNEERPMDLNVQDSRSLAARNRLGWTLGDQTPPEASSLQSGPSRWKSQHRRCCSSAYTHSDWSHSFYRDTGTWDRNC